MFDLFSSQVRAVVIGLGAGLLPMFLHGTIPFMHVEVKKGSFSFIMLVWLCSTGNNRNFLYIQVVELDSLVLNLAREYFDFIENDRMKVIHLHEHSMLFSFFTFLETLPSSLLHLPHIVFCLWYT